jgi:hypothetical protein
MVYFLDETTLNDLYNSTIRAFPKTTRRQHAIDPIEILELNWTPYVGLKSLFVKASVRNETRHYNPMLLFKDIRYGSGLRLTANDGKTYLLERLSAAKNEILVRCECKDFAFRFNYYDYLDKSLYGRKRKKYESLGIGPPANPLELPGMCKHLIKMAIVLKEIGILI